jgi:hypothetical protein
VFGTENYLARFTSELPKQIYSPIKRTGMIESCLISKRELKMNAVGVCCSCSQSSTRLMSVVLPIPTSLVSRMSPLRTCMP